MHQLKWPLLGLLIIFLIHFIIPSYWNGFALSFGLDWRPLWDNELATQNLYSRLEDPVFSRRLLTIHLLSLGQSLGIPPQFSFILVNSAAFIAIHFGLLALAESLHGRTLPMVTLSLPFTLSFSVLFAFLAAICSYDDWLQYALLLWGLVAIERGRYLFGLILFVAACCARETSLFLLPLSGWLVYRNTRSSFTALLFVSGVAITYGLLLWVFWGADQWSASWGYTRTERFEHWRYNFQNLRYGRESIGVILLVLGLPFWMLLRHRKLVFGADRMAPYGYFTLGLIVFNTILVLVAGRVREARLLYLPVLLILPLIAPYWRMTLDIAGSWRMRKQWIPIALLTVMAALFIWWYTPSVDGTGYFFRAYAGIYVFFWGILVYSAPENGLLSPRIKN